MAAPFYSVCRCGSGAYMSLLHQVLQDIDKRDAVQPVLPPSLQLDHETPAAAYFPAQLRFRRYQPVFWLLLILIPVFFYLSERLTENGPEKVITEAAVPAAIQSADIPENADIPADSNTENTQPAAAEEITAVITSNNEIRAGAQNTFAEETQPQPSVLTTAEKPVKEKAEPTASASAASVVRSDQEAQQHYLQALDDLASQQFSMALEHINQALVLAEREDYLAIKLRIYLEQKEREQFLQFYAQHASVLHSYWLAVAAPGLHLFGRYDDAVRVYQQLILAQPDVVNWPLALAQALHSAGRNQQARSVLESLYEQNRLTPDQQRWVEQRLKSLR
jgi:tetratricopeptide (TPR) repeat protein